MNGSPFAAIAARLNERAAAIAEASLRLRRDPLRAWRNPRALWPLFTKD